MLASFLFIVRTCVFVYYMIDMDDYMRSTNCTQSFDNAIEVRSLIYCDCLDLAVDRKITDIWFPHGLVKSFRSSSELITDSPVYHQVVKIASPPVLPAVLMTAEIDAPYTEMLKFLQCYGPSLIDALDLAVDRKITAVGPQLQPRQEHAVSFRLSVELSVQSPVYGAVKTVPPVVAEILQNPARFDRRRSLWKRSKRFIWKSMVNAARRICFCQSFVDLEWHSRSSTSSPTTVIGTMLPVSHWSISFWRRYVFVPGPGRNDAIVGLSSYFDHLWLYKKYVCIIYFVIIKWNVEFKSYLL